MSLLRANFAEETTTSIGGVDGNGPITLAPLTNMPRLSVALGLSSAMVRYVIEDVPGKRFETGIGLLSDNVLTRLRPQVTWNGAGGVYNTNMPAPLPFGASPAAGAILIRLAPTAEDAAPVMPQIVPPGVAGADGIWNQFPLSAHIGTWSNSGSSNSMLTYRMYYSYYLLNRAGRLTGLQFDTTSSDSTAVMKIGLYSIGPNGFPARRLIKFSDVPCDTTGVKTISDADLWTPSGGLWMTPGWYAIGYQNTYGISIRGFLNSTSAGFGITPVGRSATYAGYKNTISADSEPITEVPEVPTMEGATIAHGQVPWWGMRIEG